MYTSKARWVRGLAELSEREIVGHPQILVYRRNAHIYTGIHLHRSHKCCCGGERPVMYLLVTTETDNANKSDAVAMRNYPRLIKTRMPGFYLKYFKLHQDQLFTIHNISVPTTNEKIWSTICSFLSKTNRILFIVINHRKAWSENDWMRIWGKWTIMSSCTKRSFVFFFINVTDRRHNKKMKFHPMVLLMAKTWNVKKIVIAKQLRLLKMQTLHPSLLWSIPYSITRIRIHSRFFSHL